MAGELRMTQIKKYVIRHKPTGYFIPVPHDKSKRPKNTTRGGTFYEPMPDPHLIRLFVSELSAKRFLTAWLMGKHIGQNDDGYSYVAQIKPISSRIRSEMEILPAYMEIQI